MRLSRLLSRCPLFSLLIVSVALALAPAGASPLGRYKPGEIIVRLKDGASLTAIARLNAKHVRHNLLAAADSEGSISKLFRDQESPEQHLLRLYEQRDTQLAAEKQLRSVGTPSDARAMARGQAVINEQVAECRRTHGAPRTP